jgi:hypothetical protein
LGESGVDLMTELQLKSRRSAKLFSLLLFLAVTTAVFASSSGSAPRKRVPRLIFPVVGPVSYTNDFGDPRAGGRHQGNDLMAAKKSPVVAVEAGKIKFWTHSASAGCMLYLYGRSGTMYEYIHLNNDRTMKNDNRGKCKRGIAYWKGLRNGAKVKAGQPIGYVGDSGDANGIASHLHFEVHPRGRSAVSPYRHLKRARTLLFAAPPRKRVTLTLEGTHLSADTELSIVTMTVKSLKTSTRLKLKDLSRKVVLKLSSSTRISDAYGDDLAPDSLGGLAPGSSIQIVTKRARATLRMEMAKPRALSVASVTIPG